MGLEGRGGAVYSKKRELSEWVLARAYRKGWPAELTRAVGLQRRVRAVHHRIVTRAETGKWPIGCEPLRIAFVSDLHAGPTTHKSLFDDAAHIIHRHKPDILLMGGDYVFLSDRNIEHVADFVRKVRPCLPLGCFAVMGNHDLWANDRSIMTSLTQAGAHVMINDQITLPKPFSHVKLSGLDDPWTGIRDPKRAFARTGDEEESTVRILLVHAPSMLLYLDPHEHHFDVGFCGHTHGGHIALPGGIPIIAPGPLSRRYPHGRFDLTHDRTLIVSRGIGSTELPLRWNADPDVIIADVL
jgi:uncharacterized protein